MSRPSSQHDVSVSLSDVARFILRGLLPAVGIGLIAGVATYAYTARGDDVFRAEATVLVARTTGDFSQFGLSSVTAPPLDIAAYQAAAVADSVVIEALRALGVTQPVESDIRRLRQRVTVLAEDSGRDSSLLRLEALGPSPESAAASANSVAEALVAWDRRRSSDSLGRAINALEEQVAGLSEQIRSLQAIQDEPTQSQIDGLIRLRADQQQQLGYARALIASTEGLLSVLQPAGTTPRKVAPRPVLSTAIVSVLVIVFVYGLLLARSAMTLRLRGIDDVRRATGLPILAQFPRGDRQVGRMREMTSYLRTNLLAATQDAHPRVFLLTSAHEAEGKTMVACRLAEAMVGNGYRTLLVDADLRSPSVANTYGIARATPSEVSVEAWLKDPSDQRSVVRTPLDTGEDLDIVPQFGPAPQAAELLGRGFKGALAAWIERYDVIIIDSAPIRAVADALIVAPFCTGTVIVADRKRTDRRSLSGAVELLQRVGVRILGIVLNRDDGVGGVPAYGYGAREGGASPQLGLGYRTSPSPVKVSELPLDRD